MNGKPKIVIVKALNEVFVYVYVVVCVCVGGGVKF